ncbi:MAG: hypothetical protein KDA41_08410 [Planctomycetales bacterium]|nr:hypothetical protein [Planctomycetales bacterium]
MLALVGLLAGCSASEDAPPAVEAAAAHQAEAALPALAGAPEVAAPRPATSGGAAAGPTHAAPLPTRTFADLLSETNDKPDPHAFGGADFGHPEHDDARLAALGIRKISGPRLNVYTDLPQGDVDDWPRVFAAAIPQWQAYFQLPADKLDAWRMTAYAIKDRALFDRAGLIPADLPEFQHGFQRAYELWVYDQPSDYYRRHLLLHEGTHGVMNTLLGGAGPPWYMEGMAELLATHAWDGERLTLQVNPRDKNDVPYWGRVKLLRDDFDADRGMPLDSVLQYDNRAHQNVNAYAWCWAACLFLDGHPATQKAFRAMQSQTRLPIEDFNRRLQEQLADVWPRVAYEQWFLFVQSIEYGSQPTASVVDYKPGEPPPAEGVMAEVDAARGWQSSGVRVAAGKKYYLQAAGRYTIAVDADGAPWPCEPGGVTLRYLNGRPLGELLAAVRTGEPEPGQTPSLALAAPVGLRNTYVPQVDGTLYFRVNDSTAEMADNQGTFRVHIRPLP